MEYSGRLILNVLLVDVLVQRGGEFKGFMYILRIVGACLIAPTVNG